MLMDDVPHILFLFAIKYTHLELDSKLPKKLVLSDSMEDRLKMIKNTFHFMLKVPFVFHIFKFLSRHFWSCTKTS